MHILIIGSGAVGSVLAVTLARAGEEVTLARAAAAMPEAGAVQLTVTDAADSPAQWAIVPIAAGSGEAYDLVVVAVRSPDLPAVAASLAQRSPGETIVCVSGTPHAETALRAHLPAATILGLIPDCTATLLAPGRVQVTGDRAFAIAPGGDPRVVAALGRAVTLNHVPDVDAVRWARVLIQTPRLLALIAGQELATVLAHRRMEGIAQALLREVGHVAEMAQLPLALLPGLDNTRLRTLHSVNGLFMGRAARPLLDYAQRAPFPDSLAGQLGTARTTELDDRYGALVRLGTTHQVPTPTLARALTLAHELEQTGKHLTLDELERAFRN